MSRTANDCSSVTVKIGSAKLNGQAMAEFVIVVPVLILLIFGAMQVALIFSAKTTLNYATFQAARIGAVNHATYSGIRKGLIRGLAPLFTSSNTRRGPQVAQDIAAGINSDKSNSGTKRDALSEVDAFVRIVRVSPGIDMFGTSASGFGELNADGIVEIPNSQLMYRDASVKTGVNIQDANLLKIRVQYCYKLMVPLVNKIIGSLSELNNTRVSYQDYETVGDPRFADANRYSANEAADSTKSLASYDELCSGRGLLSGRVEDNTGFIISAEAIVRMQSPAYEEDDNEALANFMCDGDRMSCP